MVLSWRLHMNGRLKTFNHLTFWLLTACSRVVQSAWWQQCCTVRAQRQCFVEGSVQHGVDVNLATSFFNSFFTVHC
jgi:hypothetical protein